MVKQGYALDNEECDLGVRCIGVSWGDRVDVDIWGKLLGHGLVAFDMDIIVYDPHVPSKKAERTGEGKFLKGKILDIGFE